MRRLQKAMIAIGASILLGGWANVAGGGSVSAATPEPPSDLSREELTALQRRISHHLLRVQQERFEAQNRGEPEEQLRRMSREFKRTQQRLGAVNRALDAAR